MNELNERAERAAHNIRHIFRARHHIDVLNVSEDWEEIGISGEEWGQLMECLLQLQNRAAKILNDEIPTPRD